MRLSLKLLLALTFILVSLPAVVANGLQIVGSNPQTTRQIQSIRKQYLAINKGVGRYKKVKKELSGFSLEDGEMVAYFDGPTIVKVVATYYGETGKSLEEYYFANESLIFVYRKESRYNRPLSGKVVHSYENRFYFAKDRLIAWLNSMAPPAANGAADYQEKQEEFLKTARKFLMGGRSKAATIEAEESP
ncbi:MAG TPA: hypothetical protein VGO56_08025 [Pyrinomonadaceae bacterium]|jgi:hypothetical protein|nr:hypothetical protein [Pyrinomonadaceae bacterium]